MLKKYDHNGQELREEPKQLDLQPAFLKSLRWQGVYLTVHCLNIKVNANKVVCYYFVATDLSKEIVETGGL